MWACIETTKMFPLMEGTNGEYDCLVTPPPTAAPNAVKMMSLEGDAKFSAGSKL